MRNMKTGVAVGPAAQLIAWPIGVGHVSGAPQCHRTWTRIMKKTASPAARSKARTRSRPAMPVTAFTGPEPVVSIAANSTPGRSPSKC